VRTVVAGVGLKTASHAIDAMEQNCLEPILTFGTLLGAIREHDLIKGDHDIDLGIIVDGSDNQIWKQVQSALESAGYSIARQYTLNGRITEQAYYADGFSFDVWGLCKDAGREGVRAYYHCQVDDAEYHSPDDRSIKYIDLPAYTARKRVQVGDYMLPVPDNAEDMVACVYGPNWATPDPGFVAGTGWTLMEGVVERRTVFLDVE